jgi:DNA polymerase
MNNEIFSIPSAWTELEERVKNCKECKLCETRTNTVFGQGNRDSGVVLIGEGPGEDEDLQGLAFVGKAGQLLTQILEAGKISREDVFIMNIVKCRPPENRTPTAEEMAKCSQHLESQLALLRPKIVVCLGNTPMKWLLQTTEGISKMRGKWFDWRGVKLMPMFHPSYLLRNQSRTEGSPKYQTWMDVQALKKSIEDMDRRYGSIKK